MIAARMRQNLRSIGEMMPMSMDKEVKAGALKVRLTNKDATKGASGEGMGKRGMIEEMIDGMEAAIREGTRSTRRTRCTGRRSGR